MFIQSLKASKGPLFIGILAFCIYAYLALVLHPAQDNAFIPERSSLAAAASNVAYGAPMGTVYSGVLNRFLTEFSSTEKVLAEVASRSIEPGSLKPNTQDGNGIGYMLVADIGFRLFGMHISSIIATMLLLMGASAMAFLYRFRDRRSVIVVLYFAALTVMLFGPLVWLSNNVKETPIGGIRYFSVVAILPAFHLLLEISEIRRLGTESFRRNFVILAIQIIVFLTAILVRNSAAPTIGAIAVGALYCVWKMRSDKVARKQVFRKIFQMIVIGVLFIGALLAIFSKGYITEGRFTETVWHRIFVSVGMNPNWPYGNLREVYDCRKSIPEGLVAGPEDRNGHCVYLVYLAQHKITHEAAGGTYGRTYDAALREAFFDILRAYPGEVLYTFVVVKTRRIIWSLSEGVHLRLQMAPTSLILLLGVAVANVFALATRVKRPVEPLNSRLSLGLLTSLLGAFTLIPFYAVWATPYTSSDMYTYMFIGAGLALMAVIGRLRGTFLPVPR